MSQKDHDIYNTRMIVYTRDNFTCQHPDCDISGMDNLELAHRIAKTKANINYIISYWDVVYGLSITQKEAMEILNNPINLMTSCRKHNDYFNCGFNKGISAQILKDIYESNRNTSK